ncbi:MAG: hypothetical protein AB7F64_00105 [Gammaproteobacteria bacterium]
MMLQDTIMTSVKIPKTIHTQLLHAVVAQGYGMRGKSKWVTQAVDELLALPSSTLADLVDIAAEMTDLTEVLTIRLPASIVERLEKSVILVRTVYPAMEGVKSNIIRSAILQRLLRN